MVNYYLKRIIYLKRMINLKMITDILLTHNQTYYITQNLPNSGHRDIL